MQAWLARSPRTEAGPGTGFAKEDVTEVSDAAGLGPGPEP